MSISDIYQNFGTPPNLQDHLIRVAQVAHIISDNWLERESLNSELLIKAALLHDLANVVKFDFVKHPEFLGKEVKNIDHWKQVQKEVIEKYGNDDHVATQKMLQEVGLSENIISIIQNKSFGNAIEVAKSSDWILKILFYADMRVAPSGIVSLDDRLNDVVTRLEKYRNHPQKTELLAAAHTIAIQIQTQTKINLEEITLYSQFTALEILLTSQV